MEYPASVDQAGQNYVLITAAHNEEARIANVIMSVVDQTARPLKWIIVSDASTDKTDEIVRMYVAKYSFIELYRLEAGHHYSFAAQANALRAGYDRLRDLPFEFVGTLDADITLDPHYYERLLSALEQDPKLGLTGGFIYERDKTGEFANRGGNRPWSVAGGTQFFRRECYEAIGGILPLRYGGHDWCAEVSARMRGWEVRAIPDLKVYHHRPTGTARNLLRHLFHQGRMDFSLGCLPLFEIFKCLGRWRGRPFVIGALARLAGFFWSYCRRADRAVSSDFVDFLRSEQRRRLDLVFHRNV